MAQMMGSTSAPVIVRLGILSGVKQDREREGVGTYSLRLGGRGA